MKFLVRKKDDGKRLDIFLSEHIGHLTRSNIKKTIESNDVKINKKITDSPSKKVKTNDSVIVEFLIPLLAFYGLNKILIKSENLNFDVVKKSFYISGGVCAVFFIFPS